MIEQFYEVFESIKHYNDIIIVSHVKPDGDAVGSSLAIALCLKMLGKTPKVILEKYPEKYNFIPGRDLIYERDIEQINPEVFISLDCGSKNRFGGNTISLFEKAKVTINIDHHISNNNFADYNFVNKDATSTSEIIFNLFNSMINIDKDIATAIYAGIVYDSGGFRFSSTSEDTMQTAAKLMGTGIDFTKIYTEMIIRKSKTEIIALQKGMENVLIDDENKISYSFITIKEMKQLNLNILDLDSIIHFIFNIENVEVSAFIYEVEENVFKISLRSLYIDVNKVANIFDGGGHILAAGCKIEGTKQEVYEKISKALIEEINQNG